MPVIEFPLSAWGVLILHEPFAAHTRHQEGIVITEQRVKWGEEHGNIASEPSLPLSWPTLLLTSVVQGGD